MGATNDFFCDKIMPEGLVYLEDHPPFGGKWLTTLVTVSPLTGVVGPLPNGRFMVNRVTTRVSMVFGNWIITPI